MSDNGRGDSDSRFYHPHGGWDKDCPNKGERIIALFVLLPIFVIWCVANMIGGHPLF